MTHDQYRELMFLSASGEVDADERDVLERHLQVCARCREEYADLRKLHEALVVAARDSEPDERLLRDARQELRIALRHERARKPAWRVLFEAGTVTSAYRFAVGAAFTLAAGVLLGRTVFPPSAAQDSAPSAQVVPAGGAAPHEGETKITNVRFIDHGGSSGEIEFTFDAVTPVRMRGSIEDPKVQKVLTHAMLNEENPGIRLQAVNAINRHGVDAQDPDIQSALIKALAMDANAGVRKEALNALRRFPFDGEIKTALLHALMSDANPGLRVAAINALDSARTSTSGVDSDILAVLRQKAVTDDNNYIRVKARAVIQEATQQ